MLVTQSHNFYGIITYLGPSVDFVSPLELLSIGGTKMTVDGSDFGFEFSSPISIFVCSQACSEANFVSPTSVTCFAPPAPLPNYKQLAPVASIHCPVTVAVANSSGFFDGNVTFVRPPLLLQSVSPQVAGAGVVTLIGSAFGLENPNPVVRMGFTVCATTLWQSWTQILCYVSEGSGSALSASVTIFDRTAWKFSAFSYPPPKILSVFPSSVPTIGSLITITGSNFGTNQTKIVVYTHGSPCSSPLLIAPNTITCLATAGSGVNRVVSVSADEQTTTMDALSYDPPLMYSIDPVLLPANLVFVVTVTGASLGFGVASFLLLNFSADTWPYPILSDCSLLFPHVSFLCSISTASIPSEKTRTGAVNLTALVSVDSQASAALPVAILPRSSLAQLIVHAQYSPRTFSVQLIGLLTAPSSCTIFILNTTNSNNNRRLLSDSFNINLFVISRRSESEAQKFMNDLGYMWSSNPKALQAIGIIGANFENELPFFSPPKTSSPSTRVEVNSDSLPDWFAPSISVIAGSICFGIICYVAYRCYRTRKTADKRNSQNSSVFDSEIVDVEDEGEDQNVDESFVSIDIDGNLNSIVHAMREDSDVEGVGVHVLQLDLHKERKKFYGIPIDNQAICEFRGCSVPLIAATMMNFVLDMGGRTTQGIFRLSAPSMEVSSARNMIEVCQEALIMCLYMTLQFQMHGLDNEEALNKVQGVVDNCVVASVLLKNWLRELPDSIVPQVDLVSLAFYI
jgi:hypothetical protein